MKITNKNTKVETTFGNIKVGETFRTANERLWMRVCNIYSNYYDEYGYLISTEIACNAIDLASGSALKFRNADKVTPVDCECIISDKKEA
jgi:hypothetical protein